MANVLDEVFEVVKNVFMAISEDIAFKVDDDLTTKGMDSFVFIQIVVGLEVKYGVEIPDEYLSYHDLNTVNKMVEVIEIAMEVREDA